MKKKHLLYSMALVATLAACSQDEFVEPVNSEATTVENDFSQFVGAPFEGEITFNRGKAETRMALDDNLSFAWKEGDQVGLVWTNYDAISSAINGYSLASESKEALEALESAGIVKYDANGMSRDYGLKYSAYAYQNAVKAGNEIPVDASYVWTKWPNSWKTASNTRMSYDGSTWFMTDGQVYKGMYLAYYPYDASRQSTSKFTVKQNVEQKQNATTYTNAEDAANKISNHILSTVPGEGMVWISRNPGDQTLAGGNTTQHSSFLYELTEQDKESGTSKGVDILMWPFSNILDLRIAVDKGTIGEDVAKAIEIESVELIAESATFPETAAFQLNRWGGDNLRNGVYGLPRTNSEDPVLYTWLVNGTDNTMKYEEGDLSNTVKNTIQNPAANNGQEQRVQLLLLPKNVKNQQAAMSAANNYKVRITTDYGYIDIAENDAVYPWQYRKAGTSGLWVNPDGRKDNFATVANGGADKKLDYVLSLIGERFTRYINFNANDLNLNDVEVSSTEDLVEVINKWNQLGKSGKLTVYLTEGATLKDLIWSEKNTAVTLDTYELAKSNQPKGETITLGTAAEAVQEFLADANNSLVISSNDVDVNLGGTCAIDNEKISFAKTVALDGTLGVTDAANFTKGLSTSTSSEVYVANEEDADLTVGSGTLAGEMWIYQDGNVTLARKANVTNVGTMHINGELYLVKQAKLVNDANLKLYAYADVNGEGNQNTLTNNSIVYYVDVVKAFNKKNVGYENNAQVYAEINKDNVGNHRDSYLTQANSFGATDLFVKDVTINCDEWNNTAALRNFKNVKLEGEVKWNSFKAINMPSAVFTVDDNTVFEGSNQESSLTLKQFILADDAVLSVKGMKVVENKIYKTVMNNNTTLTGYDNFSNSTEQPDYNGNGYHRVYTEDGEEMTF